MEHIYENESSDISTDIGTDNKHQDCEDGSIYENVAALDTRQEYGDYRKMELRKEIKVIPTRSKKDRDYILSLEAKLRRRKRERIVLVLLTSFTSLLALIFIGLYGQRPQQAATWGTLPLPSPSVSPTPIPPWGGACSKSSSPSKHQVSTLPDGTKVLCDTDTDGGNWVVIQRRKTGSVSFARKWDEYAAGFGSLNTDFWFGLDNIHRLCFEKPCQLRVDMTYTRNPWKASITRSRDNSYYAAYDKFAVAGPETFYKLTIDSYRGTAGDGGQGMLENNGLRFSTMDQDHDTWGGENCADLYHAGWWWWRCGASSPNGVWRKQDHTGIRWAPLSGWHSSLVSIELKVRRRS